MKFENILIESAKFSAKDIIATSNEEPTNPTQPTAPTQGNDPYVADKW